MKAIYLALLSLVLSSTVMAQLTLTTSHCTNCVNPVGGNVATGSMALPTNGFTYGASSDVGSDDVVSDFGRRNSNSRWHLGVDYSPVGGNGDVGDRVFSIENGTISNIFERGSYKILVINGAHFIGYGHIFNDGTTYPLRIGEFYLDYMDTPHSDELAIVRQSANGAAVAFSSIPGGTVSVAGINSGLPIITTNIVTEDDAVAPIGNSGGNYSAHIHLYRFENAPIPEDTRSSFTAADGYPLTQFRNPKDPLEILDYQQPVYNVSIENSSNLPNVSGSEEATIRVRCSMDNPGTTVLGPTDQEYANGVFDIEKVELFIKKHSQPISEFSLIKGPWFESKIEDGSGIGTNRYPSIGFPPHVTSGNYDVVATSRQGATGTTGIDARAYRDNPYDDYFFADFLPRIADQDPFDGDGSPTLLAREIQEARYPDARYDLRGELTTVRSETHPANGGDEIQVVIDNFQPYVQTVDIYANDPSSPSIESHVYHADRVWWETSGQLKLTPNSLYGGGGSNRVLADVDAEHDEIRVVVKFSEPMTTAHIVIPTLNTPYSPTYPPQPTVSADLTTYEWTISNSALAVGSTDMMQDIHIIGTDLNNNALLGYGDNNSIVAAADIPYRTGTTNWSAQGPGGNVDNTHHFRFTECSFSGSGGGNAPVTSCIAADFTATTVTSGPAPLTVTFEDLSSSNLLIQSRLWSFGDGSSSSDPNPTHTYSNQGDYTVSLTVSDGSQSATHTINQYIHVSGSGGSGTEPTVPDFEAIPTNPYVNEPVEFIDWTVSSSSNLSYQWEFPGGNPSVAYTAYPPTVYYALAGNYDVMLTVSDGLNSYQEIKPAYINVLDNTPPIEIDPDCMTIWPEESQTLNGFYTPNQVLSFNPEFVTGGVGSLNYTWIFRDDNNVVLGTVYGSSASFSFPTAGSYIVELQVDDTNPNTQYASCSKTVVVLNPGPVGQITLNQPVSYVNSNQWISLTGTYTGSPWLSNLFWKFECSDGPCLQDWMTPYNSDGVASNNVIDDDVYVNTVFQGSVVGNLSPGTWNISLQVGSNSVPVHASNTVQVVVGASTPSVPTQPEITGIGVMGSPTPLPDGPYGACWSDDHPVLRTALGINSGNPYYAGSIYEPYGSCTPTSWYPNCDNCDHPYVNLELNFEPDYSPQGNDWIYGNTNSTGVWWLWSACTGVTGLPSIPSGFGQHDGRLDLSEHDWSTGPWVNDLRVSVKDYSEVWVSETEHLVVYRCLNEADAGSDVYGCPGSTFTIGGDVQSGTKPTHLFEWSFAPGQTIPVGLTIEDILSDVSSQYPLVTLPEGSYELELTVTDGHGNSASDLVWINGNNVVVDVGPTINLCLGNSISLPASVTGGTGTYEYSWSPSGGLNSATVQHPLFQPTTNGVYEYSVSVIDNNGCIGNDVVTIIVDDQKPVVSAGEDIVSCPGGYVTLGLDVSGGGTGTYSYSWTPQVPNDILNLNGALTTAALLTNQSYHVIVTDDNGCAGDDWISVFIDNSLSEGVTANAGGVPYGHILEICQMGDFDLTGLPDVPGDYYFDWTWEFEGTVWNADGSPYTVQTMWDQTFQLEARNVSTGCISWDETSVVVQASLGPVVTTLPEIIVACYGEDVLLEAQIVGGQEPYSVEWYMGEPDLYDAVFDPNGQSSPIGTGSEVLVNFGDLNSYANQNQSPEVEIGTLVTDVNGCGSYTFAQVSPNPPFDIDGMGHRIYTCANAPTSVGNQMSVSGGTPPLSYDWLHPDLNIVDPYSLQTTVIPEHTAFLDLMITDAAGCEVLASEHTNRYKLVMTIESTDQQVQFEGTGFSDYCVNQDICVNTNTILGYALNFDYYMAIEQGLYNDQPFELAQQFVIALEPTELIQAAFMHPNLDYVNFTSQIPEMVETGPGCVQFTEPGTYLVEFEYDAELAQNLAGTGCPFEGIYQQQVVVDPVLGLGAVDPTQYVFGQVSLPTPQNDILAVDIRVAINQNGNSVPTEVTSGTVADHIAANSVRVGSGFKATFGSDYTAKLNPCMEVSEGRLAEQSFDEDTISNLVKHETAQLHVSETLANAEFFNVYPNPNSGNFTVSCSNLKKLTVFDASGRIVWDSPDTFISDGDQSETNIEINGFSNGIYTVKATRRSGETRFKLVVVQ